MINQTKLTYPLLENVKSTGYSDVFRRGPIHPLRVSARMSGGANGQSVSLSILGGDTVIPTIPLATIILTESESEESFTIYSEYEYIRAQIASIDTAKPGAVTVQVNALEE